MTGGTNGAVGSQPPLDLPRARVEVRYRALRPRRFARIFIQVAARSLGGVLRRTCRFLSRHAATDHSRAHARQRERRQHQHLTTLSDRKYPRHGLRLARSKLVGCVPRTSGSMTQPRPPGSSNMLNNPVPHAFCLCLRTHRQRSNRPLERTRKLLSKFINPSHGPVPGEPESTAYRAPIRIRNVEHLPVVTDFHR